MHLLATSDRALDITCILSFAASLIISLTDRKQWGKVSHLSLNSTLTFDLSADLALHFYRMARGSLAKNVKCRSTPRRPPAQGGRTGPWEPRAPLASLSPHQEQDSVTDSWSSHQDADGSGRRAGPVVPGAPAAGGDDGESKGVVAEGDETTDAVPRSSTEVIRDVLTNVFEGVATPLKMRVLQALGSGLSLLACFKLGDLISFYAETVGVLLRSETGLAKAVTQCREAAREQFSKQLASQGAKLVNSPPVRCAGCPQ